MNLRGRWQLNFSKAEWSHLGEQTGEGVYWMLAGGSLPPSPAGPTWDDVLILHIFCSPGRLPHADPHSEEIDHGL